jgi:hypothetical protein
MAVVVADHLLEDTSYILMVLVMSIKINPEAKVDLAEADVVAIITETAAALLEHLILVEVVEAEWAITTVQQAEVELLLLEH